MYMYVCKSMCTCTCPLQWSRDSLVPELSLCMRWGAKVKFMHVQAEATRTCNAGDKVFAMLAHHG